MHASVHSDAPMEGPAHVRSILISALLVVTWSVLQGTAQANVAAESQDLRKLSIEELMEIDVTLATRQPEPLGTTAAAISVITRDDIRRAGVTTIADALQLATGVHVARANNAAWQVTARGFNGSTPNKLLVMIDGRTEFSPLFAGVFWNMLDYVLEDVERIEVIRGPGATLWGANAVNGVVNVITRHTRDTTGTYASLHAGNEDPAIVEFRQGGARGGSSWRVYGKFAQRDDQQFSTGMSAEDARRRGQAGFRIDTGGGANTWFLKGDVFHGRDEFIGRSDGEWTGIAVQGRWGRTLSARSRLELQSYYRREYRNIDRQLTHHVDTVDVDFNHTLAVGTRHRVVWGGGYRRNADSSHGTPAIAFDPVSRVYPLSSVFAQDEIALLPERLDLTAGIKLEHNAFSGAELQPNVRARWRLPHRQILWGAVARAVRRPTRVDDDVVIQSSAGAVLIRGTHQFVAESLVASEIAYRAQPHPSFSTDATFFSHHYNDLRSQDAPVTGLLPILIGNTLEGRSHGVELALTLQPIRRWRTHASYTWIDTDVFREAGSRDVSGGVSEANDPHHLFGLRTSIDLYRNIELDARVRASGSLPNPVVPAYTEMALRLGWQATPRVELALIGEDLLHDQHPEFGAPLPRRVEFERSVRAAITLRVP